MTTLKIALENVKVAHKALIKAHANSLTGENAMSEARGVLLEAHDRRNVAQSAADEPNATKKHWLALGGAIERHVVAGKAYDLAVNTVHKTRYQLERAQADHTSALDGAYYTAKG
jgi:hypothetical protein